MTNQEKLKSYIYWLLVLQVCLISLSVAASSIILGSIILSVILLIIVEKKWILPRTAMDGAFLAYIVVEFITAISSDHTFDALINSKRLLLIVILYAVTLSFDSKEKIRRAIMLLSGSVAVLSIGEIILYFFAGHERLYVFQHYMTTGGLKMIVSLMVLPFILDNETSKKDRLFFLSVIVPSICALVLTNTRSAWLGLVFGVIIMSALYYRKLFGILLAAIILFFSFAPQHQTDRAKSIFDPSNPTNAGRMNMWTTGIAMWKDKPLLGFGDIDLYETYKTYRTPTGDEPAGHLHNNFIHLLVTTGAIGLGVVLFLFFKILQTEYHVFRTYTFDPFVRNIALGSFAVFTGFLMNGLFEWNFGDHEIMVFVWFTVGLSMAVNTIKGNTAV